jgi:hypothetical protein
MKSKYFLEYAGDLYYREGKKGPYTFNETKILLSIDMD